MNFKIIGQIIGSVLCLEALFMSPSLFICLFDGDTPVMWAFLFTILLCLVIGGILVAASRKTRQSLQAQEGFVTVALSWVVLSLFGALPFFVSGQIPHYVDALFEVISGFTTTGASILTNVEALSRGLLYWRSFTHWLGGMGILVFALAVVPAERTSGGRLHLMRAESPGPSVGKLTPRLRQTALILYGIYVVLTVVCFFFLLAGGMPVFDSFCTAFGTAGTGGFGIKNDSMAGYSPYLQGVCTVFMLLFGINFNIYYLLLLRMFGLAFRDEELHWYLGIFAASSAAIVLNTRSMFDSWGQAIHHVTFQVSSIMTTTGFSTVDFDRWPSFSKAILLFLMALGASAGSTGGGMKVSRFLLAAKNMLRSVRRTLSTRLVSSVHMSKARVSEDVISGVNAYFAAYWLLIAGSLILISLDSFSLETNVSAVFACFNNIGPGFAQVGPMSNFSSFSDFSKLVLSADMLLGRLEIFPMLALFSRYAWNRSR